MKIIHTADLHLGQIIYQNYDRTEEHNHFFAQLEAWCRDEQPDALLVSGDLFDIQQPSAASKRAFTDYFVRLHKACPEMHIVLAAGNHDSASRIEADRAVWRLANTTLVGMAPAPDLGQAPAGWQEAYVVRLGSGYIIALPYMPGNRREVLQSLLDYVEAENVEGKPVVMTGHLAVTGMDASGHNLEVGTLKTIRPEELGRGYDYLALGHIHKPQTIGRQEDAGKELVGYPAGVIRYSGSALHVSCDEQYPHTVSVVSIDRHGGEVTIRQLRIDELMHFYTLPPDGTSYAGEEEALAGIRSFCGQHDKGYFRLRMRYDAALSANFNQQVYGLTEQPGKEIRFNPKTIWTDLPGETPEEEKPAFEVAELQQMTDPVEFIERTIDQYPGLSLEEIRDAFDEVREEMLRQDL